MVECLSAVHNSFSSGYYTILNTDVYKRQIVLSSGKGVKLSWTDYNTYGVCTRLSRDDIIDLGPVSLPYDKKTEGYDLGCYRKDAIIAVCFLCVKKLY